MWHQPPWRQRWQWSSWKSHQGEPSYHRRERRQRTHDRTLWRVAQATNRLNRHHSTQAWQEGQTTWQSKGAWQEAEEQHHDPC
eukprot:1048002-Prorocentrum_lima.AAC.1